MDNFSYVSSSLNLNLENNDNLYNISVPEINDYYHSYQNEEDIELLPDNTDCNFEHLNIKSEEENKIVPVKRNDDDKEETSSGDDISEIDASNENETILMLRKRAESKKKGMKFGLKIKNKVKKSLRKVIPSNTFMKCVLCHKVCDSNHMFVYKEKVDDNKDVLPICFICSFFIDQDTLFDWEKLEHRGSFKMKKCYRCNCTRSSSRYKGSKSYCSYCSLKKRRHYFLKTFIES